jgi:O-antigen ligase
VFAALISGRSLFKRRWVEGALVLLALTVLVFTYSRGGLLTAIACLGIVFLLFGREALGRVWAWIALPFRSRAAGGFALRVALLAGVIVALVAAGSFLARYQYFASIWDLGDEENAVDYLVDISAGPRLAYAMAGYRVFEEHPVTGVGLGASGLYLFQHYPEWASNIPEVARQLSPDSNLIPNTKNVYIRLLAELGLPGFWLFVAFVLSFLAIIRKMAVSGHKFLQFVAAAGLFIWLGMVVRNITQDSFTVPIMWVALGLIAGLYPFQLKEFRPLIRVRRKIK